MIPTRLLLLFLIASLFCVVVSELAQVDDMQNQERYFLRSLGLSGRPRPPGGLQDRRHVPSALWRMLRRSENVQNQESDPCTVSEYGVKGNIIRYVQDQGKETSRCSGQSGASICIIWIMNMCRKRLIKNFLEVFNLYCHM